MNKLFNSYPDVFDMYIISDSIFAKGILYMIVGILLPFVLFVSGCRSSNKGNENMIVIARVDAWKPRAGTLPTGDPLPEIFDISKITLLEPKCYMGIELEIFVAEGAPVLWTYVGSTIRFIDAHGLINRALKKDSGTLFITSNAFANVEEEQQKGSPPPGANPTLSTEVEEEKPPADERAAPPVQAID
jgi:hypothetical protein